MSTTVPSASATASLSPAPAPRRAASRARIISAFAAVYVIWGSTYLAIRYAIETVPPFLMAGSRFLVAGAALYAWERRRGAARPTLPQWRWALLVGGLLLLGGNGAVVWSEQRIPSGVASLLVAVVPIWMVLFDWARAGGRRPGAMVVVGLVLGLAGLALLVGPGTIAGAGGVDRAGALVVMFGSLSWATGSILSRSGHLPKAPLLATAMEMLGGGFLLLLVGLALGESARLSLGTLSARSALAWMYLVAFGSLIGFTAYIWLLGVVSAARAATYAYVNPVVAVFLGWALASEPVTARTLIAAAIIIAAVAAITAGKRGA